jgi:hypothetical protein
MNDRAAPYVIEINDIPVAEYGINWFVAAGDNSITSIDTFPTSMRINLASFGGLGVMKKVVIKWAGNSGGSFRFFRIDPGAVILPVSNANRVPIVFEGDSLTAGGDGVPVVPSHTWGGVLCQLIGQDDYAITAVGGTGFLATSSGQSMNRFQRVPTMMALKPGLIIDGGNHNDVSTSASPISPNQRRVSWLEWYKAVRAIDPVVPIIGGAPLPTNGQDATTLVSGQLETLQSIELETKALYAEQNDPNLVFVPIWTDSSGPWIKGTANGANPGVGNNSARFFSDATIVHLNQRSQYYLAERWYNVIQEWASSN